LLARVENEDSGSLRSCIVTGETCAPEAMLRFALSPENVVTPDVRRKLPGRGVWTRLDLATVARAAAKNAFARGFRKPVKVSGELAREVDALLMDDALQFLALVNKSGRVVAGNAKVEAAIRSGRARALIHASDGAADGTEKLDRLARGLELSVETINLFDSARLNLALGRPNVIHAAVNAGRASAAFLAKVARLNVYRSGGAAGAIPAADGLTE
jgi:predicted RNA-binding protein YlxR (DUF448 family)